MISVHRYPPLSVCSVTDHSVASIASLNVVSKYVVQSIKLKHVQ